ncbi:MAG: hypothetical protein JXB26_19305 [Candidatus Aminicenantes bacterium]|nr:hypothetical protein [Candidatus Aminicenantes bacterium]
MGTIDSIAKHLILAVRPLKEAFSDKQNFKQFLYRLGWNADTIPASYNNLITKVDAAITALEALGESPSVTEALSLLSKIKDVYEAIENINEAPPGVNAAAFIGEIKDRLFEILVVDYFSAAVPFLFNLFKMLGIIEPIHFLKSTNRPSFIRFKLNWNKIPALFTEPEKIPENVFGWGKPDFKFEKMITIMAELFSTLNVPVSITPVDEELGYKFLGFTEFDPFNPRSRTLLKIPVTYINIDGIDRDIGLAVLELPQVENKLPGFIIQPLIPSEIGATLRMREDIDLKIKAESNIASLFGFLLRPNETSVTYPFQEGTQLPEIGFGAGVDFKPSTSYILLGDASSTRLELKEASVNFDFKFSESSPEVILGFDLSGLAVVIQAGESDSFLQKLLGSGQTKIGCSLGIEWSNKHGFNFKGGGAFEVALYPHLSLGPLSIDELQIALKAMFDGSPELRLEFGAGIKGELGPLTVVVQGIGFSLAMIFESGGNAGPFDIKLGFKPPNGIGLSIDGGGFKGGGYLRFEPDNHRYTGVLEIEFQNSFSLKAIGLLTTKLPDGSDGFSLLIVICTEFTPIQLGFGFTLNGVGGLLGLNRTAKIDVLRQGIKTNSLSSVLFPKDVVANANKIISDLRQIFPPEEGRFVFGPMARIGWGTPTLLTIDLGLIIEVPLPLRIALMGVIKVILPDEELKLIRIQVNFLGAWEQDKKLISFDASLYDSKLISFPLAGDMALRILYGDDPNFLISVGGFHPSFTPPPLALPPLHRIDVNLIGGNNPRLALTAYFAVTSNTVQLGAKIELLAKAWKFNVYGFLAFDALFQFSPFYFIVVISGGVAVRCGSSVLFSIGLSLSLEGPTPWIAKGKASFKILFVKVKVRFSKTWGEDKKKTLPDIAVLPKLIEALSYKNNWRAQLPSRNNLLVSLREIDDVESEHIVAHPAGVLTVSQKIVPLNKQISRFGNQRPSDGNKFYIHEVTSNGTKLKQVPLKEHFAPSQFEDMDDAKKLSSKSFEKMEAGVKISDTENDIKSSKVVPRNLMYETIIIDTHFRIQRFLKYIGERMSTFVALLRGSCVAKSRLSFVNNAEPVLGPGKIKVAQEGYTVVGMADLFPYDGQSAFGSQAEALGYMNELVQINPDLEGNIQVVSNYEVPQAG